MKIYPSKAEGTVTAPPSKSYSHRAIIIASLSETEKRENRALEEACKELNLKEGTIITFDTKKEYMYNEILIKQVPVYEYFLSI